MAVSRIVWAGLATFVTILLACVGLAMFIEMAHGPDHRGGRAKRIVEGLDKGCQMYRLEYGVYPPGSADFDSRVLHRYLGSNRKVKKKDGTEVDAPPILSIPMDWLDLKSGQFSDPASPVALIDPWERPIRYRNPGRFNPRGVDIWSLGKNGKEDLGAKDEDSDDVTNLIKEY